jgi:hypothetical protein
VPLDIDGYVERVRANLDEKTALARRIRQLLASAT